MKWLLKTVLYAALLGCVFAASQEEFSEGSVDCSRWLRIGNRNFHIYPDIKLNWFGAWNFCKRRGQTLATSSELEHEQIISYLELNGITQDYWIGGMNLETKNPSKYTWMKNGLPVEESNWCPGEPNNFDNAQNCIKIKYDASYSGCWDDNDCTKIRGTICESAGF